ncbi:type III-B CRISPR module RAMP protein Cmr1 [Pontibacter sp. G13]|uniref:type III-B CRISPR module RAMP protein Cmr1 n=1 Tax=Pontibacter sp. G13 TaxID=3074898 RepID=UPI0028895969|nr:type III-B CRISPR module RAMP protein Cmr1 [Pontibacter sp. G13]WNJ18622.1 type III-B CRISPR module RAMP protein Cmr1 [Pontibacter sp. G13]
MSIYKCKVLTPMFMAGADQTKAELRSASFKGALRFWWRALYGGKDVRGMRKQERELFGGVGENGEARRSKVLLRVVGKPNGSKAPISTKKDFQVNGHEVSIFSYLGYGSMGSNNALQEYIPQSTAFELTVDCPEEFKEQIENSLAVMASIGGVGARSRNGFGTFEVLESSIPSAEAVFQRFASGEINSYTSLSDKSRLFKTTDSFESPLEAFRTIGLLYRKARLDIDDPKIYDNRKFIGAPLNQDKLIISKPRSEKKELNRHSKPFFIGVEKTDSETYNGYLAYLPYRFLEKHDEAKDPNLQRNYFHAMELMNSIFSQSSALTEV